MERCRDKRWGYRSKERLDYEGFIKLYKGVWILLREYGRVDEYVK